MQFCTSNSVIPGDPVCQGLPDPHGHRQRDGDCPAIRRLQSADRSVIHIQCFFAAERILQHTSPNRRREHRASAGIIGHRATAGVTECVYQS